MVVVFLQESTKLSTSFFCMNMCFLGIQDHLGNVGCAQQIEFGLKSPSTMYPDLGDLDP